MEAITAPYGFVPLSHHIVYPEWVQPVGGQAPPLHDVPFEDGVCGTLELVIEAETPLFTRGARDKTLPFQLADERYAVPGTALRGALRNVIEIATFGRFSRVNDHRYAVRDLHNRDVYGKHMADIVNRQPMPLVNAGWLRRDEQGNHVIEVCDFAKLEYKMLMAHAQTLGLTRFDPGKKQSSVDKYAAWGGKSLEYSGRVEWLRPERPPFQSRYGVVREGAGKKGQLVFTGQPSVWTPEPTFKRKGAGNPKHHDFLFFPAEKPRRPLPVSRQIMDDFVFAHSDRGQQNNLGRSQEPNKEWAFWKTHLEAGKRVPVFFLTHGDGALRAFGLAMMFRLPYLHSIGQAIAAFEPEHRTSDQLDFAEGLFGTVRDPDPDAPRAGALALKGRIGISHAVADAGVEPTAAVKAILGAPKASYYPNYVEQNPQVPGAQPTGERYRTWMDPDAAPRGWKRYRPQTELPRLAPPAPEQDRVASTFRPLPAGTKFRAHVDLHNLRPEEVGAVLWALDFGGDPVARHTLGMARPLGYGKVRLVAGKIALTDMAGREVDRAQCLSRFVAYMEAQVPGWGQSAQIKELVALARPISPQKARYQTLSPNEFIEAKKRFLALESAVPHARVVPGQKTARPKPSGPGTPAPSSSAAQPWVAVGSGTRIQVRLTTMNKKGTNWHCEAVGYAQTKGTIVGTPPEGAASGQVYEVVVKVGHPAFNLQLQWPD